MPAIVFAIAHRARACDAFSSIYRLPTTRNGFLIARWKRLRKSFDFMARVTREKSNARVHMQCGRTRRRDISDLKHAMNDTIAGAVEEKQIGGRTEVKMHFDIPRMSIPLIFL